MLAINCWVLVNVVYQFPNQVQERTRFPVRHIQIAFRCRATRHNKLNKVCALFIEQIAAAIWRYNCECTQKHSHGIDVEMKHLIAFNQQEADQLPCLMAIHNFYCFLFSKEKGFQDLFRQRILFQKLHQYNQLSARSKELHVVFAQDSGA